MKLATLAKKAAALPEDVCFEWGGPDQYSDYNFDVATADHAKLVAYVNDLRKRMAEHANMLKDLQRAYKQMRDLILEAEVSE
jgi:hypothetical protein